MSATDRFVSAVGSEILQDLRKSLHRIEIRSNVLPTYGASLQHEAASDGSAPSGGGGLKRRALRVIQPVVEVHTAYGPLRLAPAGEPKRPGALFPVVVGVAAGAAALALGVVGTVVAQGAKAGIPLALAAMVGYGVYKYQRRRV
mgnify:CR=1 FL=1